MCFRLPKIGKSASRTALDFGQSGLPKIPKRCPKSSRTWLILGKAMRKGKIPFPYYRRA